LLQDHAILYTYNMHDVARCWEAKMGTRNLTIVKVDGKTKIAQYGQWDGYPTGQGYTIADFIQNHLDLDKMKEKTRALKRITKKDHKDRWTEAGADPKSNLVNFTVSDKFADMYPFLSRDTGSKILRMVQDGVYTYEKSFSTKNGFERRNITVEGVLVDRVQTEMSFLKDKAFCEYAYEVDLDKQSVKVFVGGNAFKTIDFENFTRKRMDELEKEISQHLYGDEEETA